MSGSMTGMIAMRRNSKGFYTVETVIFLPMVLLAVLSLGYFMKVEGVWENAFYGAIDESTEASRKAYDGVSGRLVEQKIKERVAEENPELTTLQLSHVRCLYTGTSNDNLTSYQMQTGMKLELPLGFSREFSWKARVKYRNFVGKKRNSEAAGEALSKEQKEDPVWVFPNAGERYHTEHCTYVRAEADKMILDSGIKKQRNPCGLCGSGSLPYGSIVYCFRDRDTCYHKGTCRSIDRHSIVMDRTEAKKRGYTPCSKCGGG